MIDCNDWEGNSKSVFRAIGASNHSDSKRQSHDFYAIEPKAAQLLLCEEAFAHVIWECACGKGHLSKVFENAGYSVLSTDLVYRGFGQNESVDFLLLREGVFF